MGESKIVDIDLNRVEGDLEVKVAFDGERITDAWCVGTLYRGFEQMLRGRVSTDGLVITPRVCGICGTAHHYVAATALEMAWGAEVAPHGTRLRNLCLMAEEVQSDARHTFLMFTVDLCHPRYADRPGFDLVEARFRAFEGSVYVDAMRMSREILKVVAIFGGQWPHATYMVPGGVTARPQIRDLIHARALVDTYERWYEEVVLGCSSDRWLENQSVADVDAWVDAAREHAESAVGTFWRFARGLDLHRTGRGEGNLLSYGNYCDPEAWRPPYEERALLRASGFRDADTGLDLPFDHQQIVEHIKYSYFAGYEGGRHPWEGETLPEYVRGGDAYSWAKAPRYGGKVCEVGPLADLYHAGDPLILGIFAEEGSNSFLRQLARFHRPVRTLRLMRQMIDEILARPHESAIIQPTPVPDGEGFGTVGAARGALAHWMRIADGKIDRYQIITPTAWNASPRDSEGVRGHWEQTMIGTAVQDIEDPIELAHIVRSHDACLVCTVHVLETDRRIGFRVA